MYCVKKIKDDIYWVGGNDRRLELFEGVYRIPSGVSYNSYFIDDEKTALIDTVDKSVAEVFFANLKHVLHGRNLDYIVVQHMEPDHSATLERAAMMYPDAKIVCTAKCAQMIRQFFSLEIDSRLQTASEGDVLDTGRHRLTFLLAPMVHWPEVMVTYDAADKILFSADAFGSFGAQNGDIFLDEPDSCYINESRRYYTNIVGKYGPQVTALLKKAAAADIEMICPLHGYALRNNLDVMIDKYTKWSSYTPEESGVLICYASVYGNTQNAAEVIAGKLSEKGIKTCVMDVSKSSESEIVAMCFKYSHIIFASTTYNNGVFISMENVLNDIAAHNLQNRTIAFVQNGSWAPSAAKAMAKLLEGLKNCKFIGETVTIKSALKDSDMCCIDNLAEAVAEDLQG